MTIIAVEEVDAVNPQNGQPVRVIHMLADSRLTRGRDVLTDIAPKILPIGICIMEPRGARAMHLPYGFAYAGSSLTALSTHATLQHCLLSLFGNTWAPPPSIDYVASLCREISERQMRGAGARMANGDPHTLLFDCVISGYHPQAKVFKAFHLHSSVEPDLTVSTQPIDLTGPPFRAGSGSSRFDELRDARVARGDSGHALDVMSEMLEIEVGGDYGGYLQAALVEQSGFFHSHVITHELGDPYGDVRYLDIDINELPRPDDFKFGQTAFGKNPGPEPIKPMDTIRTKH